MLAVFIIVMIIIFIHTCCTDVSFLIFVLSILIAVAIILYRRYKVRRILNVQEYAFNDAKLHQNHIDKYLMELVYETGFYIHGIEEVRIPYSLKKREGCIDLDLHGQPFGL